MFLKEFIEKYCRDIIEKANTCRDLLAGTDLPYDYIITDDSGTRVRVINADGVEIPIYEILTTSKADFYAQYVNPEVRNAYDKYLETVEIIEGEAALEQLRNDMKKAVSDISTYNMIGGL